MTSIYRQIRCAVAALWLVASGAVIAQAQVIEGADDPALRAAALAWLHREDTRGAVIEIARLGAEGNVAAQVMTNRIFRIYARNDFPDITGDEYVAMLGIDVSETRLNRIFWHTSSLLDPADPLAAGTLEAWIAQMENWRETGDERAFYRHVFLATFDPLWSETSLGELRPGAIEYLEGVLPVSSPFRDRILLMRAFFM